MDFSVHGWVSQTGTWLVAGGVWRMVWGRKCKKCRGASTNEQAPEHEPRGVEGDSLRWNIGKRLRRWW